MILLTISSIFFQIFEVWLTPWLNHIEEKAKEQITKAVDEPQRNSNDSPVKKPLAKKRSCELGFLDEIEGAKDVVEIIQRCTKPWKEILQPYHKKGDICRQFLQMLHELFLFYVDLLEKIVLSDN